MRRPADRHPISRQKRHHRVAGEPEPKGTTVSFGQEPAPTTLAAKLERLISITTPEGGTSPSYNEIARAIDEAAGERVISASYIWKLHKGETTNPRLHHLQALARYFDVPAEYFLSDSVAVRVDEQLEILRALKSGAVRNIALRANGLSRESLHSLSSMVEHLRTLEKTDPPDE
jgi:transcriptional regulator with XRE-family HTH domain